ncbi:MAG: DUF4912 domain-containing protein [Firmicutes bacterium]|nr:DUF4912 domain-containing protein [Bacillota bacterium]
MREQATEGQSPQGGNNASDIPLILQGTSSPSLGKPERQHGTETASLPTCPVPHRELSRTYGEDYIVLLTRDPSWLFAYWEITPAAWSQVRGNLHDHECRTVLRIYHLDPEVNLPQTYFDITVQPFSQAWHIQTGKRGGSYQAGIGIRTLDGTYREISRSNIVTAPRGSVSPIIDEEWLTIQEFQWVSRHPQPGHSPMEWQRRRQGRITALGPYPTSPGIFSPMGTPPQVP